MRERRLLRLVGRMLIGGSVVVAVLSAFVWAVTVKLGPIAIISLGTDTNVRFWYGEAQLRHVYEYDVAPPVPNDQWHATAVSRGWVIPPERHPGRRAPLAPRFAFSSGHVTGISGGYTVAPARYWLLHVPLWAIMLPGIVAGGWATARWARNRGARRRGFRVVTDVEPPDNPPLERTAAAV